MRESAFHHLAGEALFQRIARLTTGLEILIALSVFAAGCSTTSKPVAEAPAPAAASSMAAEPPHEISNLPPPEAHEVQAAIKRVFKDSVQLDTSRKAVFVTGDFNGDLSQDLVVVITPDAARIAELNEEFPSWILRDVSGPGTSRSPRLAVAADETLLAVIHGYGPNGWRDEQATQTFLLKNAAGSNIEVESARKLETTLQGRKRPTLHGDVLGEVLAGKPGYLYYGNATYLWFDAKTFNGEAEARRMHGARAQIAKQ